MSKEKLKIGLLINSYHIANWQFKIIKELKNSGFAEVNLVIKNNTIDTNKPAFSKLLNNVGKMIFKTHLKLDEFILGKTTNYSKKLDSKILLHEINEINVMPIENGLTEKLNDNDIEKIKSFNLDILLKFGFGHLSGEILTMPKYGVWLYGSANDDVNSDKELGYWEVIKKLGTIDTVLQIINEDSDSGRVIHRSWILTNPLSITKNRNLCYWRAASIIPRIIEGQYNFGESYFLKLENRFKNDVGLDSRKLYKSPSPVTALTNVFIHFLKVNKRLLQKMFFIDHWEILYKIDSNETFLSSLKEFKSLPTPLDRFWADPFVISNDDRYFIFVEELIYKTSKGHIAVVEIDNKGNFIGSEKVIERPYHLSYPFLFNHDGTYYMIPETGENKTVEVYKCIEFPYKWEFVMNLMEGVRAGDATVFYHNNKWWLFCCIDKTGIYEGLLDELYLFYSDNLFTKDWQQHPGNPINTDTRTARPAGKIFINKDKIYRPSQDCSGIYGRGININEIIKLSETEYEEVVIEKVIPKGDTDIIGTHTFNAHDRITLIDGFKYRRRINA